MPGSRVPVAAVHLVPKRFDREGVFADEELLELRADDARRFGVDGAVESFEALVGFDFQIARQARAAFGAPWSAFAVFLRALIFVDVDRLDLVLPVDADELLAAAFEPPHFDGRDF